MQNLQTTETIFNAMTPGEKANYCASLGKYVQQQTSGNKTIQLMVSGETGHKKDIKDYWKAEVQNYLPDNKKKPFGWIIGDYEQGSQYAFLPGKSFAEEAGAKMEELELKIEQVGGVEMQAAFQKIIDFICMNRDHNTYIKDAAAAFFTGGTNSDKNRVIRMLNSLKCDDPTVNQLIKEIEKDI